MFLGNTQGSSIGMIIPETKKYKLSIEDVQQIVSEYNSGKKLPELSIKFKRSKFTIYNVLVNAGALAKRQHKNNRKLTRKILSDPSVVRNIFQLKSEGHSFSYISKKFDIPLYTLRKVFKIRDVNSIVKEYSRFVCNDSIFKNIDTHESAYWLGFIAADGHVADRYLKVALSSKDKDHLEKLKNFLGTDYKILHSDNVSSLTVYSAEIVEDLRQHGFSNNKTYSFKIPSKISKDKLSSYILGVFDGDGSFAKNKTGIRFSLAGCFEHLEQIQSILIDNCGVSKTKILPHTGCYSLEYQGSRQIEKICKYMYGNCSIFLERKHEKYKREGYARRKICRNGSLV